MSDKITYEQLQEEIKLQKSNQAAAIKEYGEKISKLDKEIKELTDNKEALLKEIKDIKSGKDELLTNLRSAAAEEYEKSKAVTAELKQKAEEFELEVKKFEERKLKAEKIVEDHVNKAILDSDEAAKKEKEYIELIKSVEALKRDLSEKEIVMADKEREFEKREKLVSMREQSVSEKEKCNASVDEDLKKREKEVALKNVDLNQKIEYQRDLISKTEQDKKSLSSKIEEYEDLLSSCNAEHNQKMQELVKQAQANSIRSKELDAGFNKLEEEKKYVKSELKKLEEIQKQLSK